MTTQTLVKLTDGRSLDVSSGAIYAATGQLETMLRRVGGVPMGGTAIDSDTGQARDPSKVIHGRTLSWLAARMDAQDRAKASASAITLRDGHGGESETIKMDLAPGDVHIPSGLGNVALGYRLTDSIADTLAPVVPVTKQIDKYFIWDKENTFNRLQPTTGAPGANVAEVGLTLSEDSYSCISRAVQSPLATETIANADAPLKPWARAIRRCLDGFVLEREFRVIQLLATPGNWDSTLVSILGASAGWATGASADPVKDLQNRMVATWMPGDLLAMSEGTFFILQRQAAFQKYIAYKSGVAPLPNASEVAAILNLPPFVISRLKYNSGSGAAYVFDAAAAAAGASNGAVILVRNSGMVADGEDISTAKTFRWTGANAPDAEKNAGGFLVRTYFDNKRGPLGSYIVVVVLNDAEKMTSAFVGGLITGVQQLWPTRRTRARRLPRRRPRTGSARSSRSTASRSGAATASTRR